MTTNIYLARLLAEERAHDFRTYADAQRRRKAALTPEEPRPSFLHRLFHREHDDDVKGGTWQAA